MAHRGREAAPACRRPGPAPYVAAGELIPAAIPECSEPAPTTITRDLGQAPARLWIRPLSEYDRRETSHVHGSRYG